MIVVIKLVNTYNSFENIQIANNFKTSSNYNLIADK